MSRPTPKWLDAQYNNRALVPEHPQLFERWANASALARQQGRCEIDVAYGPGSMESLDVFLPERAGAPVFVFVHGGYWRGLDKSQHSFVAPSLVEAGAMVVLPNYALCPAVSIEHITLQIVLAVAWTHRHAARFGGDRSRIVVAGHSAGGHLAAMMLCCDWPAFSSDLPPRLVDAALSVSGLFDLEPLRHAPFIAGDLKLDAASVRRLSPAGFPAPAGTLTAVVGGDESGEFRRQNALIREAWGARAVPVCEEVPGTNHFTVVHDLADTQSRLFGLALGSLGLRSAR
jgi:arylformamidase